MARVVFASDLQRHTGAAEVQVAARCYRDLLAELCRRFPDLDPEQLDKMAVAIDGVIIHEPLLQQFGEDSELVFVPRIAGG